MRTHRTSITSRRRPLLVAAATLAAGLVATMVASSSGAEAHGGHDGQTMRTEDQAAAMVATARYQDVAEAEQDGWANSIDTLGCFQDPRHGGMGVHYVNGSLMDAVVDITRPEALVYELDASGNVAGLLAHEYIVPVEAWTSRTPPRLFGMNFHRHPVLPLWVLHTWMWKPNPAGMFADWNPAVRPCPDGVPIFGIDLPE